MPLTVPSLHKGLHSDTVKAKSLTELVDPQSQPAVLPYLHLEVKPLSQSMRIGVLPHIQPILPTIDPHCCIQVTTLKLAIEYYILSAKITLLPARLHVADKIQVCLLR